MFDCSSLQGRRERGSYITDPFKEVLSHKYAFISQCRLKGYCRPTEQSYLSYWEMKVKNLLEAFSSERSLRKGISIVKHCHRQVTNKEAFCALAATDGDVAQTCGKLSELDFHREIQLVCKIIDLGKYRKFIEADTLPCRPQTSAKEGGKVFQWTPSPSMASRRSSTATAASRSVRNRAASSTSSKNSEASRRSDTRPWHAVMDIKRADFEMLFASDSQERVTTACTRQGTDHAVKPPSTSCASRRVFSKKVSSLESVSEHADLRNKRTWTSERNLLRVMDSTVESKRLEDYKQLRMLSALLNERAKIYPTSPQRLARPFFCPVPRQWNTTEQRTRPKSLE